MNYSFPFSLFTDIDSLASNSPYAQFFKDYFITSSVCLEVLGIGLLISAVLCMLFYYGVGNHIYVLSKRIVWLIVLVITCISVFCISNSYIIGTDGGDSTTSSGLYYQSYITEETLTDGLKSDAAKPIHKKAQAYRNEFREENVSLPSDIAIINTIYAFVLFLLLSLCVKKRTTHAKAIPFPKFDIF